MTRQTYENEAQKYSYYSDYEIVLTRKLILHCSSDDESEYYQKFLEYMKNCESISAEFLMNVEITWLDNLSLKVMERDLLEKEPEMTSFVSNSIDKCVTSLENFERLKSNNNNAILSRRTLS